VLWPNAGAFGHPHQIRNRPHAHLARHSIAMQLDVVSIRAKITGEFECTTGHNPVIEYWTIGQATPPTAPQLRATLH
jgi:hypothetical protein